MKYIVCQEPGVWKKKERSIPKIEDDEALIAIKKIGVCGTDLHAFKGNQAFFNYPRILGHELAGIIQKLPSNKTRSFKEGDQVAILPYLNCNACSACLSRKTNCCAHLKVLGVHIDGGMQEQIAVPQSHLIALNELNLEAIALIEPLSIGAHALRRAQLEAKDTLVVMGCGPIGVGIIQLAKNAGFRIIALDIDLKRLQFVEKIVNGIDTVLADDQAVDKIMKLTQGTLADAVFDATGNKRAMERGHHFMKHGGKYILVGLYKDLLSFKHPEIHAKETSLLCSRNATKEDFDWVIQTLKKDAFPVKHYITHQLHFETLIESFESLYKNEDLLIKAMISL